MTDIATSSVEPTTEVTIGEKGFFERNKTLIIVVVIIVIVIIVVIVTYRVDSKANFVVTEISKKIDEVIRIINDKQKRNFRN